MPVMTWLRHQVPTSKSVNTFLPRHVIKQKAAPPTANATARGFTTSKRKTKTSKKSCKSCKRKK